MKVYSILKNPNAENDLDSWYIYSGGFSFTAMIFSFLWLILHNLWDKIIIVLSVATGLQLFISHFFSSLDQVKIIPFLIMLYVGFEAKDWYLSKLVRKGYIIKDIVSANSKEEAFLKFCLRDKRGEKDVC